MIDRVTGVAHIFDCNIADSQEVLKPYQDLLALTKYPASKHLLVAMRSCREEMLLLACSLAMKVSWPRARHL